jgi:hypothetical protein
VLLLNDLDIYHELELCSSYFQMKEAQPLLERTGISLTVLFQVFRRILERTVIEVG